MFAFRKEPEGKRGVNGGKGTRGAAGVFILTLAPEGAKALSSASRSDSATDCLCEHERAGQSMMPSGRLPEGAARITAWASGG